MAMMSKRDEVSENIRDLEDLIFREGKRKQFYTKDLSKYFIEREMFRPFILDNLPIGSNYPTIESNETNGIDYVTGKAT